MTCACRDGTRNQKASFPAWPCRSALWLWETPVATCRRVSYFLDIQITPMHFFLTGAPPRAENLLSQFICATRLAWRFEEGRSELLLPYMATLPTLILQQTPTKRTPLSPTQCCQVQLPAIVSSVLVAVDTVEVEVDIELLLLAASVL